jgi:hypothetical protein
MTEIVIMLTVIGVSLCLFNLAVEDVFKHP